MARLITLAVLTLAACESASRANVPAQVPAAPASAAAPVASVSAPATGTDDCAWTRTSSGACEPFTTTSDPPPHPKKIWVLTVVAEDSTRRFRVPEDRTGDVPLPADSPWRCRFNHADVTRTAAGVLVGRDVLCSNDGYKTVLGTSGIYGATTPDDGADMNLYYVRQAPVRHPSKVTVLFMPQDAAPQTVPELP